MKFEILAEMCIACGVGHRAAKDGLEKALLIQSLRHTKGNVSRAAVILQMHRNQFSQRIAAHDIRRKDYK